MNSNITLEEAAKRFATERHSGQVRKYTGEPYINHPAAVADIVRAVPHTEVMLAAAWLHDTVEDTDTTICEIKERFGLHVSMYVKMLTDISKPEDGNRKARKSIDRAHIALAMPPVKTIKLADLIDNSKSIIEHDPEFAKVYINEMQLLLDVLGDGDKDLFFRAQCIADGYLLRKYG